MYPRPTEVKYTEEHRLEVLFEDGVRAELDFTPAMQGGGIFSALNDSSFFQRVVVDPEAETLVWPNGADLCPDVLYHIATGAPLPGDLPHKPAVLIRLTRPKATTA
jgi:hypothetical protein